MEQTGIYVHIPFCKSKCAYCNFYSVPELTQKDRYLTALKREIRQNGGMPADTVFFGGGTPTLLGTEVCDILDEIRSNFILAKNAEITVEANPDTVTGTLLKAYKDAGINRISFGVQSFCDHELALLSRAHDAQRAKEVVKLAKDAGFQNISVDLMLAIPDQTIDTLMESLRQAVALGVTHLSLYSLKLEEGTPLYNKKDSLKTADEDEEWQMYKSACDYMQSQGFFHYEISNFAREGFACRHNLKYWTLLPYLGFGPSAHSFFGGERFYNKLDFESYFKGQSHVLEESVNLPEEYLLLGLRLRAGISVNWVSELYGKELPERFYILVKRFEKAKLLNYTGDTICLTDKGFWLSNSIITELLLSIE